MVWVRLKSLGTELDFSMNTQNILAIWTVVFNVFTISNTEWDQTAAQPTAIKKEVKDKITLIMQIIGLPEKT